MIRNHLIIAAFLLALIIPVSAMAGDACTAAYSSYGKVIEHYDSNNNKKIEYQEAKEAMDDFDAQPSDLTSAEFMAVVRFFFYSCVIPSEKNDPVSGKLSVSSTTVAVGEPIVLTIESQDDDGLEFVWAYYQGEWHKDYSDGTEFTNRFSFSESKPGIYVYKGYVYGKKPDGSREGAWTKPRTVKVEVRESLDCKYFYWFDGEHPECGYKQFCGAYVYQGLQTFETEAACESALGGQSVDCASYGSQYWCSDYDDWATECQGQGDIIFLGSKFCRSGSKKYNYCGTCQEAEGNHPLSGTLSVSKSKVSAGESFNLTISGQDGDGVKMLKAFLGDKWHTSYCGDQTSCSETYTLRESEAGSYYYYGYLFGYLPDGTLEYDWTSPRYVKVTVGEAAARGSDLIVSSVSVRPSSPDTDDEISFDVTIKNIGDEKMQDASPGIITQVSSDSLPGLGRRICSAMTKRLDSGESDTIDCPIVQTLSEGSHTFTFFVDSSEKLSETNENNNEKVKTFSVSSSGGGTSTNNCVDSDGGASFYQYGEADSSNSDIEGRIDCCKMYYSTNMGDSVNHIGPGGGACVDSGPYLYEAICESDVPHMMVYQCPNGCQDGVCVR